MVWEGVGWDGKMEEDGMANEQKGGWNGDDNGVRMSGIE